MRKSLVLSALLLVTLTHGQSTILRPVPGWNYLDARSTTTITTTKVTVKDSVTHQGTGRSTMRIDVPELRKENYVLAMRGRVAEMPSGDLGPLVNELPEVQRDSILQRLRGILKDMYATLNPGELRLKVGRDGAPLEVISGEEAGKEMRAAINTAVADVLATSRLNKRRTGQQVETLRTTMADSLFASVDQARMHSLDDLLAPYAITFPINGSERKPTVLKDVDLPGIGTFAELPAMMEIGLDEANDKQIIARVVTTVKPEALHQAMLAADPAKKISVQDVSIIKESVYSLDRSTTWPVRTTTEWRARAGTRRTRIHSATDYAVEKP